MNIAQPSTQRLKGLDSLRGLAALAVVLFHFTTCFEAVYGPARSRLFFYAPKGCFGVQLFFCISGFVILRTLERTSSIKRFAVARFARLYPAYFVCAAIALTTIAITHVHLSDLTPKAIAINASMLALLFGAPRIDPSYWTLTYEVLFYAGVALTWFVLRPRRRLEIPCLFWLACSLAGHLFRGLAKHHGTCTLLDVDYANLFVLGMMLHYISKGSRTRLTLPTFGAALFMSLFPPEVNGVGVHMGPTEFLLLISSFCALIFLAANGKTKFLDFPPLVFLGEISYSLYLIHEIVGFALIRAFLAAGMNVNVAILLTLSFIVGLAWCLRTFVEKPAERWIKSLAKFTVKTFQAPASVRAVGGF
jgi:peptidoglycan/LPS O-acetylase OafA/YrhL